MGVDKVAASDDRTVVKLDRFFALGGTVEIVHKAGRIAFQNSPADVDRMARRRNRDHASIKLLECPGTWQDRKEPHYEDTASATALNAGRKNSAERESKDLF